MAQTVLNEEHIKMLLDDLARKEKDALFDRSAMLNILTRQKNFTEKCMGAGIGEFMGKDSLDYGSAYGAQAVPSHGHSVSNQSNAIAGGNHSHQYTAAQAQQRADRWSETHLYDMLASRMGWDADKRCPFRRMLPFRVTPEKVVVFVVAGDDALVLSDEALLYPSDTLITQVRLLAEAL